jgi:hypothetical protein
MKIVHGLILLFVAKVSSTRVIPACLLSTTTMRSHLTLKMIGHLAHVTIHARLGLLKLLLTGKASLLRLHTTDKIAKVIVVLLLLLLLVNTVRTRLLGDLEPSRLEPCLGVHKKGHANHRSIVWMRMRQPPKNLVPVG